MLRASGLCWKLKTEVAMCKTNTAVIRSAILNAANLVQQGRLDEVILMATKSDLNDGGWMYELFCDCQGTDCDCETMCSDAAMLSCIRRFLEKDVS